MKRLDQLTFTRIFMVVLVLFYHGTSDFYTAYLNFSPVKELLRTAPIGVAYLYVLSGFVMSLVYFRPGEKFDIGGYWRSRFVRIYPLYIISFILVCIYYYESFLRIKPQKILANIFVVQAWIPAYSQSFNYASWSMTVEFFFYLIFPFFVMWAYRRSTRTLVGVALGLWTISQLINYVLWIGFNPQYKDFILYFPPFHLNSFILGAVGGMWYQRHGKEEKISTGKVFAVLLGSFILLAGYGIASYGAATFLPHDMQPVTGLLSPVLSLFIVALAMDRSWVSKILNHPFFVNLGESSYAVYILHVPLVWLYEKLLENSSLADPIQFFQMTFLPGILVLGLLIHFFVDTPLRRKLKNILQSINIPLALIDLAIFLVSIYYIFLVRFGMGREYQSYQNMQRAALWLTLIVLPTLAIAFGSQSPINFKGSVIQMFRPVFFSVTAGSFMIGISCYLGYTMGLFENFPRSIFVYNWLIVLGLSLGARFLYRSFLLRRPDPVTA